MKKPNMMTWRTRINQEMQAVQNAASIIGMALVHDEVEISQGHMEDAAARLEVIAKSIRRVSEKCPAKEGQGDG